MWLALFLVQPLGTAARAAQKPGGNGALEAALHTCDQRVAPPNRASCGLQRDAALDAVARAHSEDMAARRYLAHETPEGLTPPARMKRAGVVGLHAWPARTSAPHAQQPNREIVSAWMASPVHRDTSRARLQRDGLSARAVLHGTYYFTQLYGTRPRR